MLGAVADSLIPPGWPGYPCFDLSRKDSIVFGNGLPVGKDYLASEMSLMIGLYWNLGILTFIAERI